MPGSLASVQHFDIGKEDRADSADANFSDNRIELRIRRLSNGDDGKLLAA
jgi:hypothetical protein